MTRLAKDLISAPAGYDSTTDPIALPPNMCQNLVNLTSRRPSQLDANVALSPLVLNTFAAQIDGVGWFYAQAAYDTSGGGHVAATQAFLLVVQNGILTSFPLVQAGGLATTYLPTFTTPGISQAGLLVGERVRFFGFGKEVFAVQEKSDLFNYRITATGSVYEMGIATPLPVGVVPNAPTGTTSTIATITNFFNDPQLTMKPTGGPQTVTTTTPHGLITGQTVVILGATASSPYPNRYDGSWVATVIDATHFTIPAGGVFGGSGATTGTVTGSGKTQAVSYSQTFVDSSGRESDLSTPVTVNFNTGTFTGQDALITATGLYNVWISGQVASANIYATPGSADGTGLFYLIANIVPLGIGAGDPHWEDNLLTAAVEGGAFPLSAAFGENTPPLPASLAAVHMNRVMLNAVVNFGVLQISNVGSPTQFASVPQNALNGETLIISSDQGNVITGLISFGSMFAIFLRRGLYCLQGSDLTDWDLRQLHDRGCISPDSVVRSDNHIIWLSDDGVYVASYIYRLTIEKFSKPIEIDLFAYNETTAGRAQLEASQGAFVNNSFYLAIANTLFVYSFDLQGWYKLQLSGSATITSLYVVMNPGTPGLLYVGRSDNIVCILDVYSPNPVVTGIVYRTRLLQPDPGSEAAKGQTPRTLRKRVKRVLVTGFGTLQAGSTLSINADGRTTTYIIPTGTSTYPPPFYAVQDLLIVQECLTDIWGRNIDIQLNLNGIGVVIEDIEAQMEDIG